MSRRIQNEDGSFSRVRVVEIFRTYLSTVLAQQMNYQELRGMWEAAVIEAGGQVEPGGVTVRQFGNRTVVIGRASR